MAKKKKLTLGKIRVESFVTSSEEMKKAEGGGRTQTGCVECQTIECVTFNTCVTQCNTCNNTCQATCQYCTGPGPC
jgi:hypothetical protein